MRKFRFIVLCFFCTLTMFLVNCYGKITTNNVRSYVIERQGILPNTNSGPHHPWTDVVEKYASDEGYIIIFGIDIVSDSGQYLASVSIESRAVVLPGLSIDSTVVTDRWGKILGAMGGAYGTINIAAAKRPRIPPNNDGLDDFFVAIRTSDNCLDGRASTFRIPSAGVGFSPTFGTDDVQTAGATTNAIVCELIIADIPPEEFDNAHSLGEPGYFSYYQWQPGEMIRPRYDHTPQDYQYAISPLLNPTVPTIHNVPQVLPWETPTPVLAIGCAQRNVTPSGRATPNTQNPPEAINAITLVVTDVGAPDFDPNSSFRVTNILFANPENPYTMPGITLWEDANNNGKWDPTDTMLQYNMDQSGFTPTGNPREWTITLFPANDADTIEDTIDARPADQPPYDYFIVITLASGTGYPNQSMIGGDYKIWIPDGGVLFGPLSFPQQYAGISSQKVKAIYNNIFVGNLAQGYVDPTDPNDPPDLASNVIPVFGLNIASGPSNLFPIEQILQIEINLIAYENIDPDDIAPLRNDNYSGITLWRDNNYPTGMVGAFPAGNFDISDTLIPCKFSSNPFGSYDYHWQSLGYDASIGAWRYRTYMSPTATLSDTGTVYSDDVGTETSGYDFFICLRTNSSLSYGARFSLHIPQNGIMLTGSKYAVIGKETYSRIMTGNVFVKTTSLVQQNASIAPQSQPTPVMKLDITDNGSGKSPKLTGISVEFYNKGGFTLNDLASFAPLAPQYNPANNWFNITNLNTDALKQCGVVIYQGTAASIDWNSPVMIKRYKFLTSTWFDTPPGYQFEFQSPISIPCTLYVVIRTSATMSAGDSFSVGIVGWGAYPVDWDTWASRAIPVMDISGNLSNSFVRKQTNAFNFTMGGTLDLYATASFDGIGLNWTNRTNVTQAEFIKYEIWRTTDSVNGETVVIPIPAGWSASEYFDLASRGGLGGLIDGVTYNYRLVMTYERSGQQLTVQSNRVSTKIYGFPRDMTPSRPTAVASENGIVIWFRDNSRYPYNATRWLIQRTILGQNLFTDITTVDTVPTFYNPYIDVTVQSDVVYQYRVIAQRQGAVPDTYAESYPSGLSDPAAIYSYNPEDPITAPSGGGGGCFIATAAFGTPLAMEIKILKQFRDRFLLRYSAGKKFVSWYYKNSPGIASFISNYPAFKFIVRIMLYPLIAIAWILLHKYMVYFVLGAGFLMLMALILKKQKTKKSCV